MRYLLSEIATILEVDFHGTDCEISSIVTDSRSVVNGSLFVALKGEKFDGHDFVDEALRNGAVASLTFKPVAGSHIRVTDTLNALGEIAKAYRRTLSAKVIAITGSSGKTTTKDLMACALRPFGTVVKSEKSLNNEIGVPLTIFQADASTDFLILEMGMRGIGQINYLTQIATPNVAVLLNAGSAHLSELGSRENILKAKSEIFNHSTQPSVAVTSADDERLVALTQHLSSQVVLFGQSEIADIRIRNLQIDQQGFPNAEILIGPTSFNLRLEMLGEHQILNSAAVIGVIHACVLDIGTATSALASCQETSEWRMEIVELANDITIINDAYNANPESVKAGLKALKDFAKTKRTWAVLGEMRELGASALEEHDAIGRLCVRLDISKTLAVGEAAKSIQLGASLEGSWGQEALYVEDVDGAITQLIQEVQPGDVIYIKASRAVGLERVANALQEHFGRENKPS
jgi:UDP-N-acetylmuramoyl-tripeptide--D-alanyl-D-alanine ligase